MSPIQQSPLATKIAARIAEEGPIEFAAFMEMALYDPAYGYYRGDPFGKHGDFFTAAQLQPVFGAYARALAESLLPGFESFVDLGAGRGEMAAAFADRDYRAVEYGHRIPKTKRSAMFANEFFDALPIDLRCGGVTLKVDARGEEFSWYPHAPRGPIEESRDSKRYVEEAWHSIESGVLIAIDYGYRRTERARFEQGTLMSYRKHVATGDALAQPGERDITAHVDWDGLMEEAAAAGWSIVSFGSLRSSILGLGPETLEALYSLNQMQFRSLFFLLGESFEVLVLQKIQSPDRSGL